MASQRSASFCVSVRRTIVTAFTTALVGWSGSAHAVLDDCITPASDQFLDGVADGDGVSGCTANDFGITGLNSVVVLDDGCTSPTDTITVSGVLNVSPSQPKRYDVAAYIATNGLDALDTNSNGPQCDVYIVPAPSPGTNDGDQCGDYNGGGGALSITVASTTFACTDLTGPTPGVPDGFLDVQVCSSYKQNAGTSGDNACPNYTGAVPGTSSKCNCEQVVLDPPIPVPQCTTGGCCVGNQFAAAGTTCRASAGVCDLAETCSGTSSACPADAFQPTTVTCRGDAGQCDVAETCTGASAACPADAFEPNGTTCGSPSDTVCDNPDTCNGSGTCVTNNEPNTTVCRGSAGVCDVQETCDGAGSCPADSFLSAATTCRADAGACDVAETCTGASAACPADAFEPNGTSCGSGSDTVCDNPDTCNGSGACQANNEPNTTVCRADAGACDVAETCDGAGSCPADAFEAPGTSCGSGSDTVCDNPDTCNASGTCLANNEPNTTVCRADAGQCDVAETCDGAGSCPADAFEADGTSCGDGSDTVCDNPDTCSSGTCAPNHEPGTTVCRADAGQCDVAETCNGAGACPADAFEPDGTSCGSGSDTVCDNPDTCSAGACQANVEPNTTVCRGDAGQCDVAETCDGAGACPADGYEPIGTSCGSPSDTTCDNPDTCNGSGSCLTNNEPNTTVCRADAGACDVAETCDGAGSCPADAFEADGTSCGDGSDTVCDNPDTCSAGSCVDNNEPGTTVCRADAGECDVAETCDGAGACPADAYENAGTSCGDPTDDACNNADTCNGSGTCIDNFEPAATSCEDGSYCTSDTGTPGTPDACNGLGNGAAACEGVAVNCDDGLFCTGLESCNEGADQCESAGDPCPGTECNTCQEGTDSCFDPVATACGSGSDTICDNPDTCDGAGSCQDNPEPGTTECRADAGECDVAETCDGAGNCPADAFEVDGTSCGSGSDTVCDNPDTCSAGSCVDNNEPGTTVCRADAGECDVAETCDGAGACPADAFEADGTSCGSGSDTVCDNPDTCSAGACQANVEPNTTVCRGDAGQCDVAETCDGAGACPADGYEPIGTSCGSPSDTTCDNPDTCNGSGSCLTNNEPNTTVCRTDAGECDVAETCDGAGSCPADAFESAGTSCGDGTDDACNNPDTCNGSGTCTDNFETAGTTCEDGLFCTSDSGTPGDSDTCNGLGNGGAACAGIPVTCDDGLFCTGVESCDEGANQCDSAGDPCPGTECNTCQEGTDSCFDTAGTSCGDGTDDACNNPDTCNGSGTCTDNFETAGTTCEDGLFCTSDSGTPGDSDACNGLGNGGAACAGIAVTCDDGLFCTGIESCDEGANQCDSPGDPCPGTECNTCQEGTDSCFDTAGTSCGDGTDDACNNPDTCNGSGTCTDNFETAGTTCEDGLFCTSDSGTPGDSDACNGLGNGGAACTGGPVSCDDGLFCTGVESCDEGANQCDSAGDPCPGTECNTCQEGTDTCFDTAGTSCGDGTDDACNNPDTCNGSGTCTDNFETAGTTCEDGLFCTSDSGTPGDSDACNGLGNGGAACTGGPVNCDDGLYCTGVESCDEGTNQCDSAGDPCPGTECNTCQEGTDSCFDTAGTSCGDGTDDACNNPDTCNGSGTCTDNFETAGTTCEDGQFCTSDSGTPGDPDTCNGLGNGGAACAGVPVTCDDGLYCTGTESCNEGTNQCDATGDPCPGTECNTCQEGTDSCFDTAGTSCGDGTDDACNNPDTCNGSGTCTDHFETAGTTCEDGLFCTSDSGTPGDPDACNGLGNGGAACAGVPVTCDDGLYCTGTESCNEGTNQCDATGDPCPGTECNTCQEGTDSCFDTAGTSCGDGTDDACNNPDTCNGSGTCTDNFEPASTTCDDGQFCTSTSGTPGDPDNCNGLGNGAAACATGPVDCSDGQFCTGVEICNEGTNQCDSPGDPCPGTECNTCQEGTDSCFDAPGTSCGDATDDACNNADTCDGAGACDDNFEPASTTCDDGQFCTSTSGTPGDPDNCNGLGNGAAACATGPVDCDDGLYCTGTESCNEGTDQCDATGDPCPGTECNTCQEGTDSCFDAAGTSCGDATDDACNNADTCDGAGTCDDNFEPASTPCEDGLYCTSATGTPGDPDQCNGAGNGSATCAGVAVDCNDGLYCTGTESCNEAVDSCVTTGDPCPGTECNTCQEATDSCFDPASTPCGDPDDTDCDNPDTCDGGGTCLANEDPGAPTCTAADLGITITDLTGPVQAGASTTYEVAVTNAGPGDAVNTIVTIVLDPNTQFVASTIPCVEAPAGTLTCELGTVVTMGGTTFQITVYVDPSAPTAGTDVGPSCPGTEDLCGGASVTSDTFDSNLGNNAAEVATDVVVPTTFADLDVAKSDLTAEPVTPGSNVTYAITVTNNGGDTATDVVLHETLDEFMAYVSDDSGCTVQGSPELLTCNLGDIPSNSSVTVQVVVTISMAAPVNSMLQDGDCNDLEDVCNFAIVSMSSSDSVFGNNRDSEPTDVSAAVACGDGNLDPGEQCDPPSGEICNNTIDDDGDLLIDCQDPDCLAPGFQSCDGNCQLTTACVPILNDPARLSWKRVSIHGRFILTTPVNPLLDGFVFLVANTDGEVFRAELLEGDLKQVDRTGLHRWAFRDKGARHGNGIRGGIAKVFMKERREPDGQISYVYRLLAYGDMSKAIKPRMTTQIYLDDDVAFLTATWEGRPGRWKLTMKQASAGLE